MSPSRAFLLCLLLSGCSESEPAAPDRSDAPAADSIADDSGSDSADAATPVDAADTGPVEPVIPTAHPRILLNAARKAKLVALVSGSNPVATDFLAVQTTAYDYRAWFSALKAQVTGTSSHCDAAVAKVDAFVTSEEAAIAAGTRPTVAADSYLHVGDEIGDLSLTLDWCFDQVTTAQRTRWLAYANQAVSNVWNPAAAKWGTTAYPWTGWSINNPSNNYYYSFLRATLLLGLAEYTEDPQGELWVKQFRGTKIKDELVPVFERDLTGGGSREGTGYGVAMAHLFRLYDLWEASTGERIADLTKHTRASLAFMLHQILPTYDRVAPIGDHSRDSTAALFDYHRDYANVLLWLYPSDPLAARLKHVFDNSTVKKMSQGFMRYSDFIYADPTLVAVAPTDVYPVYYAAGTGNVFMRSGWTSDATFAHFMCGPYTESHAHQDQGSFLLFKRGWLAYDQNIESRSGTVQTVRAHNLVRIDQSGTSVAQRESASTPSNLLAMQDEAEWSYLAADITPVYEGKTAITKIARELVWLKPDVLVVFDRVTTSGAGIRRIFQLQSPVAPTIAGRTATIINAGSTLTLQAMLPTTSTLRVVSWASEDSDMTGGYRFESDDGTGDTSLFLNVLSIDGGSVSAVADDVTGERGVTITLKGGAIATVRFKESSAGATLDLKRSDGSTVRTGPAPLGIEALPLMR